MNKTKRFEIQFGNPPVSRYFDTWEAAVKSLHNLLTLKKAGRIDAPYINEEIEATKKLLDHR